MRLLGLMLLNAVVSSTAAFVLLWGTYGWVEFFRFYLNLPTPGG